MDRLFSVTYSDARANFLQACLQAKAPVRHHLHPLKGPSGETLATDVARSGPDDIAMFCDLVQVEALSGTGRFARRAGGRLLADAAERRAQLPRLAFERDLGQGQIPEDLHLIERGQRNLGGQKFANLFGGERSGYCHRKLREELRVWTKIRGTAGIPGRYRRPAGCSSSTLP